MINFVGNNLITGQRKWPARIPNLTGEREKKCLKENPKTLEVSHETDRLNILEVQVDVERYKTCYVKRTNNTLIL